MSTELNLLGLCRKSGKYASFFFFFLQERAWKLLPSLLVLWKRVKRGRLRELPLSIRTRVEWLTLGERARIEGMLHSV